LCQDRRFHANFH